MLHLIDPRTIATSTRRPRRSVAARSFAADRSGVAALELALCLPFMILLMMGIFDFANFAYETMEVKAAAYAGAEAAVAAVQNKENCTTSVITAAEQSATSLGTNISTSVSNLTGVSTTAPACGVSGEVETTTKAGVATSTVVSSSTCSGTCSAAGTYAVSYAKLSFSPLLSWSGLVLPSTISATAVVRYA